MRGPQIDPAPALRPQIEPAPLFGKAAASADNVAPKNRAPKGERPVVPLKPEPEESSSLGRTIASWLAAVAAVAVLGYVATLVFSRPDPRKNRRPVESAQATETAQP